MSHNSNTNPGPRISMDEGVLKTIMPNTVHRVWRAKSPDIISNQSLQTPPVTNTSAMINASLTNHFKIISHYEVSKNIEFIRICE